MLKHVEKRKVYSGGGPGVSESALRFFMFHKSRYRAFMAPGT